jgi:hypothetical protein
MQHALHHAVWHAKVYFMHHFTSQINCYCILCVMVSHCLACGSSISSLPTAHAPIFLDRCAGTCQLHGNGGGVVIKLSEPLLQVSFRPCRCKARAAGPVARLRHLNSCIPDCIWACGIPCQPPTRPLPPPLS